MGPSSRARHGPAIRQGGSCAAHVPAPSREHCSSMPRLRLPATRGPRALARRAGWAAFRRVVRAGLAEPTGDVVLCAALLRRGEQLVRGAVLDQLADAL